MKALIKRENKNNEILALPPQTPFVTTNTNIKVYLKFMSFVMWKSRGALPYVKRRDKDENECTVYQKDI